MLKSQYQRPQIKTLVDRLSEPPEAIIAVAGPRQVGKTTLVQQAMHLPAPRAHLWLAADPSGQQPALAATSSTELTSTAIASPGAKRDAAWLSEQWSRARVLAKSHRGDAPFVLVIDEAQKISRWSDVIKGLWDADRASGLRMHVVVLGSSPWLIQQGLNESLAGRYEYLRLGHWSFSEMQEAFDLSLDEYLYFGGYPSSLRLMRDEVRWGAFVRGSLIQPNIEKDIFEERRVDKKALLKALFEVGCAHSGQIISLNKLLGQLQDAGNTVTLAHHLELLSAAGLLCGLQKYSDQPIRRRNTVPKFNALNPALISAMGDHSFAEARADRSYWGRLTESAVGAHLQNHVHTGYKLFYWRDSPHEVDFVAAKGQQLLAIEVKSGKSRGAQQGLDAFMERFPRARPLIVGTGGTPIADFLIRPPLSWFDAP